MEQIGETIGEVMASLKSKAQNMRTLEPRSESEREKPVIPKKRFDEASKESIDPELWEKIEPFFSDDRGLFIFGTVGTGKTYLCHVIKKEWGKRRLPGRISIAQINDLFLRIKETFKKDHDGEAEQNIINDLTGISDNWNHYPIEILILDDIGTEKPTEWAQETLFTIIDRRYRECRKTIFTSNLSLDELSDRLGDRITSRISEMTRVVGLIGKDRRIKG